MATLDELQAAVARDADVTQSAIVLLNGIAQQLKDAIASNDPAKVQAVLDGLNANTDALAAAVAANTQP